MEKYQILENGTANRFEIKDGDHTGFLDHKIKDGVISLLHTEVPEAIGGKGIAQALAAYAFDYAKAHSLKVKIYCPFINTWIKRHPKLQSFVQEK